jgi:nitrate reductase cytochrome c-type subunit
MSSKQVSPLTGAIILAGFIAIGITVLFFVRGKLLSQEHGSHHEPSWKSVHAQPHKDVEPDTQPRTVLTAFESSPRPGAKVRTLREFYSRRAYAGAPPVIGHDVEFDGVMNDDCLSCHKDGGFVPEYNAYTPVTPHPEMDNCRQCHVPQTVEEGFVKTDWIQPDLPKRGRQAIPGGPLLIPHSLQFRENCLACHAGPHAVVEIKTSHPERQNCQQCHVVDRDLPPFKSLLETRVDLADVEK